MALIRNAHSLTIRPALGRTIMRASSGLSYLLRDEFTTALPAGSVNGTNCEPGPGTPTTLTTAASEYSAGANLVAMCDGTEFRLWYNDTHIGTGTDPALPAGTRAGLYTTDTGNGVDNFSAWARGTEGQYAPLVRY